MSGYFDTEFHEEVKFHAAELVGTPFVAHTMLPGAGIDCVHVNAWIYLKTGFLSEFIEPKYSVQEGKHTGISPLVEWLERSGKFFRVETPQLGDTLCFRLRQKTAFHTGLMLDGDGLIHIVENRRAEITNLVGGCKAALRAIYRPKGN